MRTSLVSMPSAVLPRVASAAVAAGILIHRVRSQKAAKVSVDDALTSNGHQDTSQHAVQRLPASSKVTVQGIWIMAAVGAALVKQYIAQAIPNLQQFADARHSTKPAVELETVQMFCGCWAKDSSRSESMDAFCQLFGVPRWLRQATRLMTGLEIRTSGDALLVKQVCRLSWLSTTESFPLDGVHSSTQKRRDMRSGKQLGQLVSASGSTLQLRVVFEGGLVGGAKDTLQLVQPAGSGSGCGVGPEELVVLHEAEISGKGRAVFKEVYTRTSRA